MKKVFLWGGVLAAAILFVALFGGPSKPKLDPEAACQQEFASRGPEAVAQCQIRIMGNRLLEAERDKQARAERLSR